MYEKEEAEIKVACIRGADIVLRENAVTLSQELNIKIEFLESS